jgi:hypothetical protein
MAVGVVILTVCTITSLTAYQPTKENQIIAGKLLKAQIIYKILFIKLKSLLFFQDTTSNEEKFSDPLRDVMNIVSKSNIKNKIIIDDENRFKMDEKRHEPANPIDFFADINNSNNQQQHQPDIKEQEPARNQILQSIEESSEVKSKKEAASL